MVYCVFFVCFVFFLGENTWFIHVFFGEKGVERSGKNVESSCRFFVCFLCVLCFF